MLRFMGCKESDPTELCVCVSHLVVPKFFVIPWTIAHQAPLSMELSRQELLEWVAIPFSRGECMCTC